MNMEIRLNNQLDCSNAYGDLQMRETDKIAMQIQCCPVVPKRSVTNVGFLNDPFTRNVVQSG